MRTATTTAAATVVVIVIVASILPLVAGFVTDCIVSYSNFAPYGHALE